MRAKPKAVEEPRAAAYHTTIRPRPRRVRTMNASPDLLADLHSYRQLRLSADPLRLDDAGPIFVPGVRPEALGDGSFRRDHGVRLAYLAGSMANGIGSVEIVEAMARAGMLGFFGAAGLSIGRIASAIDRLQASCGDLPHGFNLIHSPAEPRHETEVVELYLARGVRLVEASAYLDLTLPVVRFRTAGIHVGADGRVVAPNRIIAKVSRVEVATQP